MSDWRPGASIETQRERALYLDRVRSFFRKRGVWEVETPSLAAFPAMELHSESIPTNAHSHREPRYLITSPEYHMKRLLAAGSGSIYQICKAFRQDETGRWHNPEFTMIEWYRVGWDQWQLMDEIDELLNELLRCRPADRRSYREVFAHYLEIDPFAITRETFLAACARIGCTPPKPLLASSGSADDWLDYLMAIHIEERLGEEKPLFVYDYPASQANLAKIHPDDPNISKRFEIFYRGLELGNGFEELTDVGQQKRRFENTNEIRKKLGKTELKEDFRLSAALDAGLPECSGIAMGFDRLLMLATGKRHIGEVISFCWDRC